MAYKVLIPEPITAAGKQYLIERGYELKMGSGITEETLKNEVKDCQAILARTANFTAAVLEAAKDLKVIGRHGVGFDNIDIDAATRLGIYVTNAPESNANTVAEHTIGLMIALARNLPRCDSELRRGNFAIRNELQGADLAGKVLGVIGIGRIGRRVAQIAAAGLDMVAIGFDPYLEAASVSDIEICGSLEEVLKRCDFLSLHVPATDETLNLIGRRELEMMKPTAYLINAARGGIIVESDLAAVLAENGIAGAALDVYAEEPPDPSHPLFKAKNVIVTPHNASLTRECKDRMGLHAAQGIHEVLSGKPPTWPVNPTALGWIPGRRESMSFVPKGIIPAMVTPLTETEALNEKAFRRFINYLIDRGLHGIFVSGTTGEFYGLSPAEKQEMFEIAVEEAGGRVPVYAGTGAITTKECILLTQIAERCGVDAVSILTPMFISPSQEELYAHYTEIARSTSLPILLYNNLPKTGVTLTPETVDRLARIDNIVGVKDSSGDFTLTSEYIRRTAGKDFAVLIGRDTLIHACLCYGGSGSIAACANIAPRICADIYDRYMSGDIEGSLQAQLALSPLRLAFTLGSFPTVIKEGLKILGIDAGPCMSPIGQMNDTQRQELERIIGQMGLLG